MFGELYDRVSLMFWRRWPTVEATITAVNWRRGEQPGLVVTYEFSVGQDGPYTGEALWPSRADDTDTTCISDRLRVGRPVTVRYRPDDPSVNTVDHTMWWEEGAL